VHPLFTLVRCRFAFTPKPGGVDVTELANPLPHVLLVPASRVLREREAILAAMNEPAFDPRRTVILEREPIPAPAGDGGNPGTVRVLAADPDALTVEADVSSPAILLVTDLYSRDWHVRSVGAPAQAAYELLPADYVLRAIPLAAGHHALRLEYSPRGFGPGVALSLATLAGWVAALIFARRRRGA